MILFSEYVLKRDLLNLFEKEKLDLSEYNMNLVLENWSKIKKGLIAGGAVAALASPYLLSRGQKQQEKPSVVVQDKESELKSFREKNKVEKGELESLSNFYNIKQFDPNDPRHVMLFHRWRELQMDLRAPR